MTARGISGCADLEFADDESGHWPMTTKPVQVATSFLPRLLDRWKITEPGVLTRRPWSDRFADLPLVAKRIDYSSNEPPVFFTNC